MNLEILDLVGKRLIKGEEKYGYENVTNDGRDFIQEALEESLDLAVYVAAKLIEIKQKENKMGRAIEQEKISEDHERRIKLLEDSKESDHVRIKLLEDALEEHIQTRVHHIDLHSELDEHEKSLRVEGVELEPDEEYTAPVGKRKKTKKIKTATVE